MSWSVNKVGRASKLGSVIREVFEKTGGAPAGSHEEAAKNQLGAVAEILCQSFDGEQVVSINANGSAWNENGKAKSQHCKFELSTYGDFIE